mgnify:FL=1
MRLINAKINYLSKNSKTIYDFKVKDYKDNILSLKKYEKYKAVIIVNVASYWGLTPQNYEELQYLYEKYESRGLMILGFPSNQFGNQEPKSNEEIQEFVKNKNVTFPIFGKIDVNGKNEDPLYTFMKDKKRGVINKNITWNFTKFLCINGIPKERYGPRENPKSFENQIVDYLNRNDDL